MGQARDLAARWFALFDAGDVEGATALAADDCEVTMPGTGTMDRQTFAGVVLPMWLRAFGEGRRHEILDVVEEGDVAVVRVRFSGTNTGPMATPQGEIPATGRHVSFENCAVVTAAGGRITSWHSYFDQMSMLTQLGIVPEPATA